jgi:hypothetical protein
MGATPAPHAHGGRGHGTRFIARNYRVGSSNRSGDVSSPSLQRDEMSRPQAIERGPRALYSLAAAVARDRSSAMFLSAKIVFH